METFLGRKGTTILYCEKCDYTCFHQSKYERHLGTAKHRRIKMDKKECDDSNRNNKIKESDIHLIICHDLPTLNPAIELKKQYGLIG